MELSCRVCKAEALVPVRSAERIDVPKTTAAWLPQDSAGANDDQKYEGQAKDDERCGLYAVREMQSLHEPPPTALKRMIVANLLSRLLRIIAGFGRTVSFEGNETFTLVVG